MDQSGQPDSLVLSHEMAAHLVDTYGTPLYVLDESVLRRRVSRYLRAFRAVWPDVELTYASKANSTLALLRIVWKAGCTIDVASEGEFRAALAAGVPASDCHLHGNNKSVEELRFAQEQGIAQIVVDCTEEIERIAELGGRCPDLLLRLAPGVSPITNEKIRVGQNDTKFGFNIGDGQAENALLKCLELGLPVKGFHCHVGSQLLDPGAQIDGGVAVADFAHRMRSLHGFSAQVINLGGGLGIPSAKGEEPLSMEEYCRRLTAPLSKAFESWGNSVRLVQEPGRSIAGPAGVTLYTVGAVKSAPLQGGGNRIFVAVDGGLADNPRPSLYDADYSLRVTPVGRTQSSDSRIVTVSGRHCETDRLFPNVEMDAETRAGDIIQVLATGAYNSSMASTYNRYPRPATVLLRESGKVDLVQTRETWSQLLERERVPEDI